MAYKMEMADGKDKKQNQQAIKNTLHFSHKIKLLPSSILDSI